MYRNSAKFRVQGLASRDEGSGCSVLGVRFRGQSSGIRIQVLGFKV